MQLGQGKEKARLSLKENPKITEEIKGKILAAGGHNGLTKALGGDKDAIEDADATDDAAE